MPSYRWKRIGFGAVVLASALEAQKPATTQAPAFDVVSIHVVPPNTPPTMREIGFTSIMPGGQFIDSRTTLMVMIAIAYDMKNVNLSQQLVGLPKWAEAQSYSIVAKRTDGFPALPPAENDREVRQMLRALLADRFHLQLHAETRQEAVFQLGVANGGLRIKAVDPPVPPAKEGYVSAAMGDSGGRMIGNKSTMLGIANALGIFLARPVIDRSALKGYYDFDVRWRAPEGPDGQPPSDALGADGLGLLISNLRDQFGLRLTKTTGPVPYWVVDHVEPPTDN